MQTGIVWREPEHITTLLFTKFLLNGTVKSIIIKGYFLHSGRIHSQKSEAG